MAGYSKRSLVQKLGIRAASRLALERAPLGYVEALSPLPDDVLLLERADADTNMVQAFFTQRAPLAAALERYRQTLASHAVIWVCWPKQSSKLPSEVNGNVIRELALPLGWVDIKVCAVTEVWSGLKLMVRRELR